MKLQIRLMSVSLLSFLTWIPNALSFGAEPETLRYRVTVQNVTAANAISPFLAVALKPGAGLFEVGEAASPGLAAIAETGNTSMLESELMSNRAVVSVAKASGGPLPASARAVLEIRVPAKDVREGARLHLVAMIGKSNDSFIAIRDLDLRQIGLTGSMRMAATNFDAGSEENTGNVADFGPGGHPTSGAEGFVSYDRGLNLRGDAPEMIGWGPTAAMVTVEAFH